VDAVGGTDGRDMAAVRVLLYVVLRIVPHRAASVRFAPIGGAVAGVIRRTCQVHGNATPAWIE
jgi:hypothetical protein